MASNNNSNNNNNNNTAGRHVAFAPLPVAELIHDNDDADKVQHPLQDLHPLPTLTTNGSLPVAATVSNTILSPTPLSTIATTTVMTTTTTPRGPFRDGFSTSVCEGLFADPQDRTSCCALTCCATFLQDRNRYIVTGELPSHLWCKRIGASLGIAIVIPLLVGSPLLVWIGSFVALGVWTTNQRQALRMRIMREFIQQGGEEGSLFNSTNHYNHHQSLLDECGCFHPRKVHRMCACVKKDRLPVHEFAMNGTRSGTFLSSSSSLHTWGHDDERSPNADVCTVIWKTLALLHFGCCGCWWNCWGACATAQEERELKRRLGKERFQIDMITMQAWTDYFPAIQDLRERTEYSVFSHLEALSKLAKQIMCLFGTLLVLIALIILLVGNDDPMERLMVVGATLGQALLVLYIVHWRRHRFDLSLDAVIKLFGAGFCFSTGIAMIVELITSAWGYLVFLFVVAMELGEEDPSDMPSPDDKDPADSFHFMQTFAKRHILTFVIFVAFQAFIVAGLTEEFSKFFCFWMVEHPDYPDERDDDGDAIAEKGAHSTAAAITCGMVATATGFACAENLLYVFGGGLSVSGEIEVLLLRSCFPIHPICAAIQSIGICRRDVEKDGTQLGQAILPALLLHGTFDFVLMVLAVLKAINQDIDNDPDATMTPSDRDASKSVELPSISSLVISVAITAVGLAYYFYSSNQQKHRLNAMAAAHDSSLALT